MPVKISIITPTYNEEDNVETCYTTIRDIFDTDLKQYELEYIFTDNCSTDGTARELRRLAEQDPRVKLIFNSRNYGVLRSNFNALTRATGDAVLVALLSNVPAPTELLPEFVDKWRQGFEVVYGIRQ